MPYADPQSQAALQSMRRARRKHYRNNRRAYMDRARERRRELENLVRQRKSVPCTDCGRRFPYYVMQFDHVTDDKVGNIGEFVRRANRTQLLAELEKCEVVCANCHAIRTWSRYRALTAES